jgi:DNA polymerase-3 subunit gamma/tau
VVDVEAVRRVWPDVVARLAGLRRVTWMLVRDHATVASFDGRRLVLSLRPGPLASYRSGAHAENDQHALIDELGVEAQVEATSADGLDEPAPAEHPRAAAAEQGPGASARAEAAASWADTPEPAADPDPAPDERASAPTARRPGPSSESTKPTTPTTPTVPRVPLVDAAHDQPSRDDVDAADSGLVGRPVVEQLLGGKVIDETDA